MEMYAQRTSEVKRHCTWGGMDGPRLWTDNVRMTKSGNPHHFIREWRKHRGLTLEQLAERLHTTHATLSRIERGLLPYNQPLLERLAEELGTDPASLIMRNPEAGDAIWSIWDTLTPVQRTQLEEVAKVFKKAG